MSDGGPDPVDIPTPKEAPEPPAALPPAADADAKSPNATPPPENKSPKATPPPVVVTEVTGDKERAATIQVVKPPPAPSSSPVTPPAAQPPTPGSPASVVMVEPVTPIKEAAPVQLPAPAVVVTPPAAASTVVAPATIEGAKEAEKVAKDVSKVQNAEAKVNKEAAKEGAKAPEKVEKAVANVEKAEAKVNKDVAKAAAKDVPVAVVPAQPLKAVTVAGPDDSGLTRAAEAVAFAAVTPIAAAPVTRVAPLNEEIAAPTSKRDQVVEVPSTLRQQDLRTTEPWRRRFRRWMYLSPDSDQYYAITQPEYDYLPRKRDVARARYAHHHVLRFLFGSRASMAARPILEEQARTSRAEIESQRIGLEGNGTNRMKFGRNDSFHYHLNQALRHIDVSYTAADKSSWGSHLYHAERAAHHLAKARMHAGTHVRGRRSYDEERLYSAEKRLRELQALHEMRHQERLLREQRERQGLEPRGKHELEYEQEAEYERERAKYHLEDSRRRIEQELRATGRRVYRDHHDRSMWDRQSEHHVLPRHLRRDIRYARDADEIVNPPHHVERDMRHIKQDVERTAEHARTDAEIAAERMRDAGSRPRVEVDIGVPASESKLARAAEDVKEGVREAEHDMKQPSPRHA